MKKYGKIVFCSNPDTNYVYHMLSVAGCGYDNAYGEKYRSRYDAADLSFLKQYENELTVCGGEHCGKLYHLCVTLPARAEIPCVRYYESLLAAKDEDIPPAMKQYKEAVFGICRIMIRYYVDYMKCIWPEESERISHYIEQLSVPFGKIDFTALAETAVGTVLSRDVFSVCLVSSVCGGAEAIDISDTQDVFGIDRSPEDALWFIGHEFIIYLLKQALHGENAFKDDWTWPVTEGMAEYYLKKVLGSTRFFTAQQSYVRQCEALEAQGVATASGLYRMLTGTM